MMERKKHSKMFKGNGWSFVVSLTLAIVILLPGNPAEADDPVLPLLNGDSRISTATAAFKSTRPPKGNPSLGSSLNQLLEVYRSRGMAEAQVFSSVRSMVLQDDLVQVTIVTSEEAIDDVRDAVEGAGGEYQLHYKNLLQAMVPVGSLEVLALDPDVLFIREPHRAQPQEAVAPIPMAGSQTSEGVLASNAAAWQAAGHNGTGVRVAVIDIGFTGFAGLLGTDLPASVNTYDWTGTGMGGSSHGTACAEIVYDMAPGLTMDLHKVSTEVEVGNAVNQAIADGVDIISMSLGWDLNGPGDGTGSLADIINTARSNGILFAVAAGNNAYESWSGTYNESGFNSHLWAPGQDINYFGPGDGTGTVIPGGSSIRASLHWDDWTAVDQDYDLYLLYSLDGSTWNVAAFSVNTQDGGSGQEPTEEILLIAPFTGYYGIVVEKFSATRNVCLRLFTQKSGHLDEWVPGRSLTFPGDAPDAFTVGAVDVGSYGLESYSSRGPTFGPGGTCSGGSTKPDIASYANVSTVSHGPGIFNGTSAATPHVAGGAALVKGVYPGYTVTELESYLESDAIDLGIPGKDNRYGSGRLYLTLPHSVATPSTPSGVSNIDLDTSYIYTDSSPSSSCSQGHSLEYRFNWGDGSLSGWSSSKSASHSWSVSGIHTVSVRTRCFVNPGIVSAWSPGLTVTTLPATVIKTISVGSHPDGVAVMPDGSRVYVANRGGNTVSVIQTSDNTVTGTISVGYEPRRPALTPDGSYAYVGNMLDNTVSVVRTSDNMVIDTVSVGTNAIEPAVTPDGSYVYVTTWADNAVSVIRTSDNAEVDTISVGSGPSGIAVTPDGSYVYLVNENADTASVIQTLDNTVTDTISVGRFPRSVAVTPDGNYAYVTNRSDDTVSVIRTLDNTVIDAISVGDWPMGLAVTPDGSYVYVTNRNDNTVSIIQTSDNAVHTFSVGSDPLGVGVTPDGNYAYVANSGDDTVSVIGHLSELPASPSLAPVGGGGGGGGGCFISNSTNGFNW